MSFNLILNDENVEKTTKKKLAKEKEKKGLKIWQEKPNKDKIWKKIKIIPNKIGTKFDIKIKWN